jgi:hypothetical protein
MDNAALTEFNLYGVCYIVAKEVDPSKSIL